MSAQINLYNPRYLKQRELLALGPVLAVALGLYLLFAVAGGWMSREASRRQAMAAAAEAQLKLARAQVAPAMQAAAERKPSAQLLAEVENVEALLRRREGILRLLEGGAIGTTAGFAEHLRALARQAPEGLWLTGFSISAGGGDIRISGSTLNAATVPDYIGRLGREKAFHGKSFSALTMQRPAPSGLPGSAGDGTAVTLIGAAVPPAPTVATAASSAPPAPQAIDFVLLPKAAGVAEVKP